MLKRKVLKTLGVCGICGRNLCFGGSAKMKGQWKSQKARIECNNCKSKRAIRRFNEWKEAIDETGDI